jgi:RNase H-fold protein (predicted Holliday junction resolvase)
MKYLIAIDPGRRKCGIVILNQELDLIKRDIIPTDDIERILQQILQEFPPSVILMGSGTYSRTLKRRIKPLVGEAPFKLVEEKHSTELARKKYFADHPPRGWRKLVPQGLQVPGEPYDDYAALVLVENYLKVKNKG